MLTQNLVDWFIVVLRWAHIVAILGWVGASLYFMWLDSKLRKPANAPGVLGEAWMGHGGGFYIVQKRQISPGEVPSPVYWFRNEAAITWVTGFLLLVFVYYWGGGVDLIDSDNALVSPGMAIAIAIGLLAVSWVVYDTLWASKFAAEKPAVATIVSAILLLVVVYAMCRLFSGRAAYIHIGAVMGTNMVGNVWRRIIPAQEQAVAATSAGRERDMAMALRARRRAQHNTYLTLPVIFTMIAAHAPSTYSHGYNWVVMALLIVAGIAARHVMILFDRRLPVGSAWLPAAAPLVMAVIALSVLTTPQLSTGPNAATGSERPVSFTVVRGIVALRCVNCHAQRPVEPGIAAAPGGVRLDSPGEIVRHAAKINATTIATRAMPPGNFTKMTDEERALIGRWVATGAHAD
ncbi:urate hydroxylase PuuD [Caenimonas soli]|uniref:urate hydroxylase PuuD n=1 Tax=Caenimonas soli TaxID=2735555 RepID=UPI001555436C|nr:urate hydroxylase PuuD [Caenimonas soli]NPC58476.1 urate hydroxylase PuuD [Caenimonas soli]